MRILKCNKIGLLYAGKQVVLPMAGSRTDGIL